MPPRPISSFLKNAALMSIAFVLLLTFLPPNGANAAPSAPVNVVAQTDGNLVSLSWLSPPGATSYNIKRSSSAVGPFTTTVGTVLAPATSYVDTTPTAGDEYYYQVSALDAYGESANSVLVTASTAGTLVASPSWSNGAPGVSARFYGTGSISATQYSGNDFGTSDFTIGMWILCSAPPAANTKYQLASKRAATGYASCYDLFIMPNGYLGADVDQDSSGTNLCQVVGSTPVCDGAWHYISFVRSGATLSLYVDQALSGTATAAGVANVSNTAPMALGYLQAYNSSYFVGLMDEVRVYRRALSSSEMATLATAWPAKCPTANLICYWSFEQHTGTSIVDSSGNNNTGTMTSGGAGYYRGINTTGVPLKGSRYIQARNGTIGNFGTGDFTVSMWVLTPLGVPTTPSTLAIKRDSTSNGSFFNFIIGIDGKLALEVEAAGAANHGWTYGNTNICDGKWHFVAVTRTGNAYNYYIDSIADGGATAAAAANLTNTSPLVVGGAPLSNSQYLNGSVDDVRLYSRALSAGEAATLGNGDALYVLTTNLLSWWRCEEAQGTQIGDSTGNNNTADLYPAPNWTNGAPGIGSSFDGTGKVTANNTALGNFGASDFSIGMWVNLPASAATSNGVIISKRRLTGTCSFFSLKIGAVGKLVFESESADGSNYGSYSSNTGVCNGAWHYIAVVRTWSASGTALRFYIDQTLDVTIYPIALANISDSAAPIVLGDAPVFDSAGAASGYANLIGKVDDVRIYNRALYQVEVLALATSYPAKFPTSGLLAYWNFEQGTGLTVRDATGADNSGTMAGGVTWVQGVSTTGVAFTGTSYIKASDPSIGNFGTGNFSIGFWLKTPASLPANSQVLVGKRRIASHCSFFNILLGVNGLLYIEVDQDGVGTNYGVYSGNTVVCDGNWHYVAITRIGANWNFYVDQNLDITRTAIGTVNLLDSGTNLMIGGLPAFDSLDPIVNGHGRFTGQLDEVRVYNRALGLGEIQTYAVGNSTYVGFNNEVAWFPFEEGWGTAYSRRMQTPPDFTLTSSFSTFGVQQGHAALVDLTINPINGFADPVTLSATGMPGGVQASFAVNPASSGSYATSVTFAASSTAAPTTSPVPVTITGTTSTGITHTLLLYISIAADGDFTLSASPSTVALERGATATGSIVATTTGTLALPVTFSLNTIIPLPTGLSATVSSAGAVTFSASPTALITSEPATVIFDGASEGHHHQAVFNVTVLPVGGSVTNGGNGSPNFILSASTTHYNQASDTNVTITVTPVDGFNSPVNLTVTNTAGSTAWFLSPTTLVYGSSTLFICPGVTTGTFTITGTSGGLAASGTYLHSVTINP
ncbi:MAG: LamG-like jellyroll fold domain-containing protein [Capsulimonas sp.]|uniref:LamG-like jellyroll fold domain-containing protein n=1 Tax=Capsulimonas sp. TaxID=2494211 RepID=UPI0032633237